MKQIGKCLNCWNDVYVHDCHFQCPHCGYAENWSEDSTYQVDKEKKNVGDMPKMQVQYKGRDKTKREKQFRLQDTKNRSYEKVGDNKTW